MQVFLSWHVISISERGKTVNYHDQLLITQNALAFSRATLRHFEMLFTCQVNAKYRSHMCMACFFSVWGINVSMLGRETIDQGGKCYLCAIMVEMISKRMPTMAEV